MKDNAIAADPIRDAFHPVIARADLRGVNRTRLMGEVIEITDRPLRITCAGRVLPMVEKFGFLWTSLGAPTGPIFDIAEAKEPDRRNISAGPAGVRTSAPRAIENFLDMAHFPFVHTGILGAEPHTEVKDYDVTTGPDGVLATRCTFFQPMAALAAEGGMDVDYVYRVPHPYCAALYKSSGLDPARMDVICLFVQPLSETEILAHMFMSMLDEDHSETEMRRFQQVIFGQDKPILESHRPRRLPLDPRVETPIRADLTSIAYRRWLTELGVTYGVIPAKGPADD